MSMPPLTTVPAPLRQVPAAVTDRPRIGGRRPANVRQMAAPYLFLLPYFFVTGVFFLYPLIHATVLAFYQTSGPAHRAFVGLDNFHFVLADPDFRRALWNTTVFAVCSIGVLKGFFRLAIFAPNLVGQVFVGILFAMLFTPRYGLFNQLLHSMIGWGLEQRWLADPMLVMPAIIIAAMWIYVGFNMIYFLAALQNVDQSLVEAARIDGAGPIAVFWNVTRPAIMPVATFVVIMSTIGSFQLFELPYTLLQGFGPNNSGLTVVGYLYSHAFENGDLGTAAAVGWLLTLIILVISLLQIRVSGTMGRDA